MRKDAQKVSAMFARRRGVAESLPQYAVGVGPPSASGERFCELAGKKEHGRERILEPVAMQVATRDVEGVSQRAYGAVEISMRRALGSEGIEERKRFER